MAASNLALSHLPPRVLQNTPVQQAQSQCPVSPIVHFVAPSSRPNNGDDGDQMESWGSTGKNQALSIRQDERRTRLHRSLVLHVSDPAKVVARKIEASHRTVEADRLAPPKSWDRLIAYARLSPGFALDMAIEMGLEFDRDRESYAEYLSLQRRIRGQ